MKKLTDKQVQDDWGGLQKRRRGEITERVVRYCIKRSSSGVAKLLGYSQKWAVEHLDLHAVEVATGGVADGGPTIEGFTRDDVQKVIKDFAPTDEDDEEFQPYIESYEEQGHSPVTEGKI